MMDRTVSEYLTVGLRLGRLLDGFVDCWYGDPELFRRISAEPPVPADELAHQARCLRSALSDSGLAEARRRYLTAQLTAVECTARRLAGAHVPFLEEVRACFGVDITLGDTERYAEIHDSIAKLLPRTGCSLRSTVESFYERNQIPAGKLLRCVEAVSAELRATTRMLFRLPEGERIDYAVVRDKPWNAFNRYLGRSRSSISLNADAGRTIAALPLIVTHEAYPGHHTEHCRKESWLVNECGQDEHVMTLVNTPQCLLSEGTAELAVMAALGDGWGPWTADILAGQGVRINGEEVESMLRLIRQLMPARQDAAIMLHDRGADVGQVTSYLEQWLLLPRERAQHMVRFLTDPLWRAYSVTYVEGERLVREWLATRPQDMPIAERYRLLLDQPVLPSDLSESVK